MFQLNAIWFNILDSKTEKFTEAVAKYLKQDVKKGSSLLDAIDRLVAPDSPLKDVGTHEEIVAHLRKVNFADLQTPSYAKLWNGKDRSSTFGLIPNFNGRVL